MTPTTPRRPKRKSPARRRLHFERLTDTQFEDFTVDLLQALDFVNVDWRKGTGKASSPADRGRDIVCQTSRTEVDSSVHLETWFVDCKHFKQGVPATALQSLLAWAQAERPDVVLFVVSNFLSNTAKDFLADYEANQRPPFRIKVWERPVLEKLASSKVGLLRRHNLIDEPIRTVRTILRAEEELFHKVWYNRHIVWMQKLKRGEVSVDPQLLKLARAAARGTREVYGKRALGPWDDFEWGMLNGKLSALRWVLGSEWDFLDT